MNFECQWDTLCGFKCLEKIIKYIIGRVKKCESNPKWIVICNINDLCYLTASKHFSLYELNSMTEIAMSHYFVDFLSFLLVVMFVWFSHAHKHTHTLPSRM